MKEVKAYVRNHMVDRVIDALHEEGLVIGVAVVPLNEFGHSASDGSLQRIELTKLELDVSDEAANRVVDCIVRHARTGDGHPGDGKVFVSDVTRCVRIEDGQEDDLVLP